ncbi:hypothetical protein EV14_3068 [Prochlorococcus sp. MIT 0703]|nr:hypothetical protein EV12_3103 [Prochlorococcus sp. MIT 0701]KGG30447.1 hypothetical protein EV14_3068 [Prochlorococcus sp. MIT 0703]
MPQNRTCRRPISSDAWAIADNSIHYCYSDWCGAAFNPGSTC